MPWDLIGHEWAVSLLCRHIQTRHVRHAYLFTGPPGIGKRTLALHYAQALMCLEPAGDEIACGRCRACRQVRGTGHPDLHIVTRAEGKSEIAIEQVRELQRQISLSPLEAGRRVAILADFHEASDGASNALLKTLEEPAGETVLILTAPSAESVLPTIASRCEVVTLRPVETEAIETALLKAGASDEQARLLAGLASGRPGWALEAHNSPPAMEGRQQALTELRSLLTASRAERFAAAERLQQDDNRTKDALETWLSFWRDVLLVAYGAEARIANVDRRAEVERLAQEIGPRQARQAALAVERTLAGLARHANQRLALETLMLDLPRLRGR
ncbi:MAG TPA: DNA polymerase III subunit delta' [Anaerolineales bacterium]|nr:DNA polymerase III subunit delta' [Anaerolineales bacterium]